MTFGVVMSIPGQTMGVSVFTSIFIERLELSRVQISLSYLLGTAASGFLLPYGGVLLDRLGVRKTVVYTAVLFGLVSVGMGQCDRVAGLVSQLLHTGHSFAAAFCVITAGFFGLRFLGQGMLTIASRAMLGKWFDRRRGFTLALSGALIALAFSAAPKLLDLLIERLGWRETYGTLGATLIFGMTAIGWLLFRDNPEECGLEMDGGRVAGTSDHVNKDFTLLREMTRSEAMRTYSFWAFNLGTALQSLVITAYTFHIVSIGEDSGLSKDLILSLFFPIAGVGLILSFVCGWIADRTRVKFVLVLLNAGLMIGTAGMLQMHTLTGRILVILGLGVAGGAFQTALGVVWPRFYGRRHLGAISGFNMSTIVISSAAGPFLFSLSREYLGEYHIAFGFCSLTAACLAASAFFADNPQQKLFGQTKPLL